MSGPRPHPLSRAARLLLSGILLWGCGDRAGAPIAEDQSTAAETLPHRSERSGRPSVSPTSETRRALLEAFLESAVGPAEGRCGPYDVLTTAPPEYLAVCASIGSRLDAVYEERLAVEIAHEPAGLVALFGTDEGFRRYASEAARLRVGYAAFTLASRGVVALSTEDEALDRFAQTLAHELAHLAHRRTFGPGLPPWLSEGLADAIGDTAFAGGFSDLEGLKGAGHLAARLLEGIDAGRTEPLSLLLVKSRREFDRGTISYDYETSALLVRFLLLDPALAPGFQKVLERLATNDGCDVVCLLEQLGVDGPELEARFNAWLANESPD